MAADPQRQEAPSNDLFGRWLAHHHEQQTAEQGDHAAPVDTPETAPAQRRMPAAAVASSAVERDPLIGSRIVAPSTFGVRRSASGPVNELDREPPAGWEPIVLRSVRKKTEQAEAKQVPKTVDRRSRLQRLKARLVDPPPEREAEVEVETPQVPLTPPVARSVPLPVVAPQPPQSPLPARTPASSAPAAPAAPAAPVARSVEETIRAAAPTIERPAARHAEPRVEEPVEQPVEQRVDQRVEQTVEQEQPVASVGRHAQQEEAPPTPVRAFIDATPRVTDPEPEPVAESVVFEAEPEPLELLVTTEAPESIETAEDTEDAEDTEVPETVESTEPPESQPPRRSFRSLARRQPKESRQRESGRDDRPGTSDAARDLVAAKARARAASLAPVAQPVVGPPVAPPVVVPPAQPAAVAVAAPPEADVEPARKVSKHDAVATEMPGVYKFAAKRTSRRLLTISLLIGLVASAYFGLAAYEVKETPSIGLAAIVVLATAMVWAIRAGASVTMLEVHQGQLQVIQQGGRFIFDLASQYTRFEVHGEPGHRGWKVLFPRRGMAPFTVDASMVDPDDFMRVLRFFRPALVTH